MATCRLIFQLCAAGLSDARLSAGSSSVLCGTSAFDLSRQREGRIKSEIWDFEIRETRPDPASACVVREVIAEAGTGGFAVVVQSFVRSHADRFDLLQNTLAIEFDCFQFCNVQFLDLFRERCVV